MSNVLEMLTGRLLTPDLREGAKFFAVSGNGLVRAAGCRTGTVALWMTGSEDVHYFSVQPTIRKTKAEAEVQAIWLSQTGDLLFAATSVDVVAVNTSTRTMAWDYQQKRQWGFLSSIPQGGYLSLDDELTTYYSSGEVVKFDRQSRVLMSETYGYTAKFLATTKEQVFGSDGHWIWRWQKGEDFDKREEIIHKSCYSLATSGDGATLAIRSTNRIFLYDVMSKSMMDEIPCEPGLPQMVMNHHGRIFGMLSEGRVRFLNREGDLIALFEVEEDFPISIHNCGDEIVVGMRSGRLYELTWPS